MPISRPITKLALRRLHLQDRQKDGWMEWPIWPSSSLFILQLYTDFIPVLNFITLSSHPEGNLTTDEKDSSMWWNHCLICDHSKTSVSLWDFNVIHKLWACPNSSSCVVGFAECFIRPYIDLLRCQFCMILLPTEEWLVVNVGSMPVWFAPSAWQGRRLANFLTFDVAMLLWVTNS
jgi:hypothetical protein